MRYFDHNATTPLDTAAREAWLQAEDSSWQNPSSPYRASARVRNSLEAAREEIAAALGCRADEIVFNSGATEANNAVFAWLARRDEAQHGVLLSPVEHPCVLEAVAFHFPKRGAFLKVDGAGAVDLQDLAGRLRDRPPALVSVMAANNETGVIQPFREIARLCREHGVPYHCDAAQWFGKGPAAALAGIDFVTGSAHKFGGPKGAGFFRVPAACNDFHGQLGGEQERGRRAGTENYPAVAGMTAALGAREATGFGDLDERSARRKAFEAALKAGVPGVRIVGKDAPRLWNTVSVIMPRHENHRWVMKLDREGFAVSTGSACATGSKAPSHVLAAMGYSPDETKRVVRVSAGWETGEGDWRELADAIERVWRAWEDDASGDTSLTEVISLP